LRLLGRDASQQTLAHINGPHLALPRSTPTRSSVVSGRISQHIIWGTQCARKRDHLSRTPAAVGLVDSWTSLQPNGSVSPSLAPRRCRARVMTRKSGRMRSRPQEIRSLKGSTSVTGGSYAIRCLMGAKMPTMRMLGPTAAGVLRVGSDSAAKTLKSGRL
jgi:hypothetical protein